MVWLIKGSAYITSGESDEAVIVRVFAELAAQGKGPFVTHRDHQSIAFSHPLLRCGGSRSDSLALIDFGQVWMERNEGGPILFCRFSLW